MKTMKQVNLTVAAVATLALLAPAHGALESNTAAEPTLAIQATHVLIEGDTVIDDGLVLVADGKIVDVGTRADLAGKFPAGLHVVEHDGWLSAGLVAANGTMGLTYTDDSTSAFMEELLLAPAFDPDSKKLTEARNLGITSFGLVAGRSNVIGGVGAVVKTDGAIVVERGSLSICLAPPALQSRRFPTSYGGALRALRARLAESQGPLAEAGSGSLPVQLSVNSRAEIARAIDFGRDAGFRTILRGATRAGDFAADLKAADMMVALAPLGLGASPQSKASILALAEAGVPFAFGIADTSTPARLRESAALSVRAGLDRATAWRAVTSTAANMLGAADHIGQLAPGFDADLVLWSGDPLSITSRPVAVYLNGEKSEGDQN